MKKQQSIKTSPLLDAIIIAYQLSSATKLSRSSATTRLLIRGIVAWIEDDCAAPAYVQILLNEYAAWHSALMADRGWTYDEMSAGEQRSVSLYTYLLLRLAPQHGGKRPGSGRKHKN